MTVDYFVRSTGEGYLFSRGRCERQVDSEGVLLLCFADQRVCVLLAGEKRERTVEVEGEITEECVVRTRKGREGKGKHAS